ncbi:MAG: transposase [Candidatus Hydrogenedentes bacterium]|nr:transposase [Candidatus Hydrogenedentota bacterium]
MTPHNDSSQNSLAPLSTAFFNPYEDVIEHWHNLPHWQQEDVWQLVTWRLGDSIPKSKLDEWYAGKQAWLKAHPQPWDEATAREYHLCFSARIDGWLDAGHGSCVLRNPRCATIVADALRHFAGERYVLDAFVVMPNHVHALFRPIPPHELEDILHSWKSFTAKAINKLVNRTGPLWQEDYWDRMIRNEAHFHACQRYIVENPINAKLSAKEYILDKGSTGVPPVIGW